MVDPYLAAVGSVVGVSLLSLIGASALAMRSLVFERGMFVLVSLAVGALFGDAIIHLIPEAFDGIADPTRASLYILAGILAFFILEKFLLWHHHHGADEGHTDHVEMRGDGARVKPLGYLVLLSDGVHNLVDGVVIGASYLISIEVGIATTIAIVLHEIPHEFADFALLLHSGFSRARALFLNFISALPAVAGTFAVLILGNLDETIVPIAAAIAAGNFLYIAGADLVPELHKHPGFRRSLVQFIAILAGIGLMLALLVLE